METVKVSLEKQSKKETTALNYTLLAYFTWGLLPLYWKSLATVDPMVILAQRIVWSFLFVALLITYQKRWPNLLKVLTNRKELWGVLASGILISFNWYTYIWGVNNGKVLEASLGYYINPLLTAGLGILVLKEKFRNLEIMALVLAFLGVLINIYFYGKIPWVALVLSTSFALYGLAKKLVRVGALEALALETIIVFPIALFYLLTRPGDHAFFGTADPRQIALLIGAGIITAIPLLWFAIGTRNISFNILCFVQYLSPTISLFLGILVFHEPFTLVEFFSFTFILSALGIFTYSRVKTFGESS